MNNNNEANTQGKFYLYPTHRDASGSQVIVLSTSPCPSCGSCVSGDLRWLCDHFQRAVYPAAMKLQVMVREPLSYEKEEDWEMLLSKIESVVPFIQALELFLNRENTITDCWWSRWIDMSPISFSQVTLDGISTDLPKTISSLQGRHARLTVLCIKSHCNQYGRVEPAEKPGLTLGFSVVLGRAIEAMKNLTVLRLVGLTMQEPEESWGNIAAGINKVTSMKSVDIDGGWYWGTQPKTFAPLGRQTHNFNVYVHTKKHQQLFHFWERVNQIKEQFGDSPFLAALGVNSNEDFDLFHYFLTLFDPTLFQST